MHRSSGPPISSPERARVVGPHGVYPLPRDLCRGPVREGEPASNDPSVVLKLKLELLLQLRHLWRMTAIISGSGDHRKGGSQKGGSQEGGTQEGGSQEGPFSVLLYCLPENICARLLTVKQSTPGRQATKIQKSREPPF